MWNWKGPVRYVRESFGKNLIAGASVLRVKGIRNMSDFSLVLLVSLSRGRQARAAAQKLELSQLLHLAVLTTAYDHGAFVVTIKAVRLRKF